MKGKEIKMDDWQTWFQQHLEAAFADPNVMKIQVHEDGSWEIKDSRTPWKIGIETKDGVPTMNGESMSKEAELTEALKKIDKLVNDQFGGYKKDEINEVLRSTGAVKRFRASEWNDEEHFLRGARHVLSGEWGQLLGVRSGFPDEVAFRSADGTVGMVNENHIEVIDSKLKVVKIGDRVDILRPRYEDSYEGMEYGCQPLSLEELNALPVGSVVYDEDGDPLFLNRRREFYPSWRTTGAALFKTSEEVLDSGSVSLGHLGNPNI